MKRQVKYMAVFLLLSALLFGCKTPVAQQTGKEDVAFLLFVSPNKYAGQKVSVTLDDGENFAVNVVKEKKSKRKGTQYMVKTGPRKIKVISNGKILYQKQIFLSSQEVKQIILP